MGSGDCFGAERVYYAPSAITLDGTTDGAAVIKTTRIAGSMPAGSGNHPAFWMLDYSTNSWWLLEF
jgi:hypothetical protein